MISIHLSSFIQYVLIFFWWFPSVHSSSRISIPCNWTCTHRDNVSHSYAKSSSNWLHRQLAVCILIMQQSDTSWLPFSGSGRQKERRKHQRPRKLPRCPNVNGQSLPCHVGFLHRPPMWRGVWRMFVREGSKKNQKDAKRLASGKTHKDSTGTGRCQSKELRLEAPAKVPCMFSIQ